MARILSKTAFLEILGGQNMAAILTAAKQSVAIEVWVMRFNAAPEIDLEYPETVAGILALEQAGILSSGTYDAFYPAVGAPSRVRVLPPFDNAWPDEYDATHVDDVWTLDNGAQFAGEYIEEVA